VGALGSDPGRIGAAGAERAVLSRGRTEPIPQDQVTYSYQMSIPAGIRKTGPWVVALSGVINTQSLSQFYLDRQSSVSVLSRESMA